ncbi:MAG: hypothetical protein K9J30_13155 [Bacteroidales bacterium]|nr:hypothetical protein [Bacteroidales bacterium]
MSDDQLYIVDDLKQKIHLLAEKIKNQKHNVIELTVYNKELESKINEREKEIDELKQQNNTLRLSKAFEAGNGETQEARLQINKIVREIDRCIALLNR